MVGMEDILSAQTADGHPSLRGRPRKRLNFRQVALSVVTTPRAFAAASILPHCFDGILT
jgi:hypothetical protein